MADGGYRAGYFSLAGSELTEVTKEGLDSLPRELGGLLRKWMDRAAEGKDIDNICYRVKGASEVFRYKGVCYVVYPRLFDVTQEYFEVLMLGNQGMEEELVRIGAEEVFCTGMMD